MDRTNKRLFGLRFTLAAGLAALATGLLSTPGYAQGHIPPGLAKKGNSGLPPGIAKKWQNNDQRWRDRDRDRDHDQDRDRDRDRDRIRNRDDRWRRERNERNDERRDWSPRDNRTNEDRNRQQTKNNWRNLTIGAGAATLYGYLKHDPTITFAGLAGTLYSLNRYEQDRKSQSQASQARAELFSRPNFDRDGHRYNRRLVTKNGQKYYQFVRNR